MRLEIMFNINCDEGANYEILFEVCTYKTRPVSFVVYASLSPTAEEPPTLFQTLTASRRGRKKKKEECETKKWFLL